MTGARGDVRSLTGLRGVAALWVVLFHFGAVLYTLVPGARRLAFVLDRGYLGVDVFFLLSGYVLALGYGEVFRTWNERAYFRFLRARLARVYPVHALMLAAVALAALTVRPFDYATVGAREFALNLVLAHAWGFSDRSWNVVSWAISVQWLGYLVFPFVVPVLSRIRSRTVDGALAALALAALMVVFHATRLEDATFYGGAPRFALEFLGGMFLYRANLAAGTGTARSWIAIAAAGALVVLLAIHRADPWAVPLLAVLLVSVAEERGLIARVLASRPLTFVGTISYSLYMTHHLAIWTMARLAPPSAFVGTPVVARAGVAVLELAALVGLGYAVYRLVESPLRKRLRG